MQVRLRGRSGIVMQIRPDVCLIDWEERIDPTTGEVFARSTTAMSHGEFNDAEIAGELTIQVAPGLNLRRHMSPRAHADKATRRMLMRKSYVIAAEELINLGCMSARRIDFVENFDRISGRAMEIQKRLLAEVSGERRRRGGSENRSMTTLNSAQCAVTVHGWYVKSRPHRGGYDRLYDDLEKSGRRGDRLSPEERTLLEKVIGERLDEERPKITSIASSVKDRFMMREAEFRAAARNPATWKPPGYRQVLATINAIAPLDHAVRTRGLKVAYRDMHAVGIGVTTTRLLERVEIDEYTVDLMVLARRTGAFDLLDDGQKLAMGLDGTAKRYVISAAIDVHSRCIVAMKIAPEASSGLFRDTIEMVLTDKSPITDGVAEMNWPMAGRPEEVVLDRGSAYASDEAYDLLAALAIVNSGTPAFMPWLRPFIERLFRTIHSSLLQRLQGRTFSDIVQKGENDPQVRAGILLDEFLELLVRWIVDIYHLTPHQGLNNQTPYDAWCLAASAVAPRGVTIHEMRHVFGVSEKRKVTRKGVRVMNVDYLTHEFHALQLSEVDVVWWHGDVGAIEARIGPDTWMTVTATDPCWLGKTALDVRACAMAHAVNDEHDRIRRKASVDIDKVSYDRKVVTRMASIPWTAQELHRHEAETSRFAVTARSLMDAPPKRDLFADVVDVDLEYPVRALLPGSASASSDEPGTPDADERESGHRDDSFRME